jgi:ATP-binding cassette subfamily F protein 3
MDIESIQWLEGFLMNEAKAVVVISHDRAFVDNITNRTIEVTNVFMITKLKYYSLFRVT